jgi:hypothetical protein
MMNLSPERQPDESFENYKVRRKEGNDFIKAYLSDKARVRIKAFSTRAKNEHVSKKAKQIAKRDLSQGQHAKLAKIRTRKQHKHVLRDENNAAFTWIGKRDPVTELRRRWVGGVSAFVKQEEKQ